MCFFQRVEVSNRTVKGLSSAGEPTWGYCRSKQLSHQLVLRSLLQWTWDVNCKCMATALLLHWARNTDNDQDYHSAVLTSSHDGPLINWMSILSNSQSWTYINHKTQTQNISVLRGLTRHSCSGYGQTDDPFTFSSRMLFYIFTWFLFLDLLSSKLSCQSSKHYIDVIKRYCKHFWDQLCSPKHRLLFNSGEVLQAV